MKKVFFFALFLLFFYAEKSRAQGGALDAGFGLDGQVTTNFRAGGLDGGYAIATLADGRFLVAGTSYNGSTYDFSLARFLEDGSLDVSFGNNGVVLTDFSGGADYGTSIALQPDGYILVAGHSLAPGPAQNAEDYNFALARYQPDGQLDNTFGNGGKRVTAVSGDTDYTGAVAVAPDGKIIQVGHSKVDDYFDVALVRYLADGTLDNSFGNLGIVIHSVGVNDNLANAIVLLSDGKILIGGTAGGFVGTEEDFMLARLLSDGTLDTTFATAGKAFLDFNGLDDYLMSMTLQPDGKILMGGFAYNANTGYDFALARVGADGTPDNIFSGDGRVTTHFNSNFEVLDMVLLRVDGRIVVAGRVYETGRFKFALARHLSNGALDPSFSPAGTAGTLTTVVGSGNSGAYTAGLQADGSVLAVGYALNDNDFDVAMVRYKEAGDLDASFGSGGIRIVNFGASGEAALACTIQPDGKIVAAGTVSDGSADYGLVRYQPNGALDAGFGYNGKVITNFYSEEDFANAVVVQTDGKVVAGGRSGFDDGYYFSLARYLPSGIPDSSFDADGQVLTFLGQGNAIGRALALQTDGKMLLGGFNTHLTGTDFALVRYLPNGAKDPAFGMNGTVTTSISQSGFGNALAVQPDGKILMGGSAGLGTDRGGALVRYLTNGQLDNSFSDDGILINDLAPGLDEITALALQPDGKILAAGYAPNGPGNDFVVARYLPNGTLDTDFGNNGLVFTDFGGNDAARAMRLLNDGRIVLGGYHQSGPQAYDFALACYLPNGEPDPNFGLNGRVLTDFNAGIDQMNALAIQQDGKIVAAGYTVHGTDRDFALARYLPGLYVGTLDFSLDENSLLVYPNPIRTEATLEYTLVQDETISIRLLDGQGRVVQTCLEGQKQAAGDYQQRIALPDTLPAGWYVLVIAGERGQVGIRIVK